MSTCGGTSSRRGPSCRSSFAAAVFRDYTRFEVRALDRRDADGQLEEAYQVADERDVDPSLEGSNLVVRFADGNVPLVAQLAGNPVVHTQRRWDQRRLRAGLCTVEDRYRGRGDAGNVRLGRSPGAAGL